MEDVIGSDLHVFDTHSHVVHCILVSYWAQRKSTISPVRACGWHMHVASRCSLLRFFLLDPYYRPSLFSVVIIVLATVALHEKRDQE